MYRKPNLFGAIYASRLLWEIDSRSKLGYETFREKTKPSLDLNRHDHADLLLKWLNIFGKAMIKKDNFPEADLRKWQQKWRPNLPGKELAQLQTADLTTLVKAYRALDDIDHIGPTIASKILFAMCPHAAMMWDDPMRRPTKFGTDYRVMLERSRDEAKELIKDAKGHNIAVRELLNKKTKARTMAKLLDEYHWITITAGHEPPTRSNLAVC